MAVPMRKLSKRRTRMRAAHHSMTAKNLRDCAQCGRSGPRHRVCENCGHYRGKEVINKDD